LRQGVSEWGAKVIIKKRMKTNLKKKKKKRERGDFTIERKKEKEKKKKPRLPARFSGPEWHMGNKRVRTKKHNKTG
jgi:hypothetical protein